MIVRNEAHGIAATLQSIAPYIGSWVIIDTGSTDGTQDIVRGVLDKIPGMLHEEPFVDFSVSRNHALELLHDLQPATWTLMVDSDDVLEGGAALLREIASEPDEPRARTDASLQAYSLNIRRGELSYYLPLVTRTSAKLRYRGRVHEYLEHDLSRARQLPAVTLRQAAPVPSLDASRKRWLRDLDWLRQDHNERPRDPRTVFYLAQTYECLGQDSSAREYYEMRAAMKEGWNEETFEATLRVGRISAKFGLQNGEAAHWLMKAYVLDPQRAEPLYELAKAWHTLDAHPATFLYARAAADKTMPVRSLFVDKDVYTWKAADLAAISGYYLADKLKAPEMKRQAREYAERALRGNPDDPRLASNLAFFAPSAGEAYPSYSSHRIDWTPPIEGFNACNPSIHWDPTHGYRLNIRASNYKIIDGRYITQADDVIRTHNFLAKLEPQVHAAGDAVSDDTVAIRSAVAGDIRRMSIQEISQIVDEAPNPRTDFPVHGFEDLRLFSADQGKQLWATATVCDFTPHGQREIVLLRLDRNIVGYYRVASAIPLRGDWSVHHQKNWVPMLSGPPESRTRIDRLVDFIYSAERGTRIMVDLDTYGTCVAPDSHDLTPTKMRGGSQAIPLDEGSQYSWLYLVHEVTFIGAARTYLHRWVRCSQDGTMLEKSHAFWFKRRGIEFCCGLAHDGVSDTLIASFSVEDREAHLGYFSLTEVLASLHSV